MTQVVWWAFSFLLPSLLLACTTGEKSALPVSQDHGGTATSIQLDKTVHFTGPNGTQVLAAPGEYLVEPAAEAQLRLVANKGGSPLIVAADTATHDIDLSATIPLLLLLNDDARNVVLLMPDGTALDAAGSLSGVQARDIVRPKRHYQLPYQLNPATGQVQFDAGPIGQRPPTAQSSVASNYRIDAGSFSHASQSTSDGSSLVMIELQRVLSQRQQAIALASNIQASLNERFHLEYNTDRPGSDSGQRATVSPEACRVICSADGSCQAFTFVKPPSGVSTGQCYLKRTVPGAVANPCCISAKRKSTQEEIIGNIGR